MYYGKYIQAGNNANAGYLPEDTDKHLRDGLRQPVPQFGDRPWWRRRVCWYSDVPEGDSIAESHPNLQGLFIATGGSGQRVLLYIYYEEMILTAATVPSGLRLSWAGTLLIALRTRRRRNCIGGGGSECLMGRARF